MTPWYRRVQMDTVIVSVDKDDIARAGVLFEDDEELDWFIQDYVLERLQKDFPDFDLGGKLGKSTFAYLEWDGYDYKLDLLFEDPIYDAIEDSAQEWNDLTLQDLLEDPEGLRDMIERNR